MYERREFLALAGAAAIAPLASREGSDQATAVGGTMYGLIGRVNCVPGQRDAFAALLLDGTGGMPGCLSYVIAADSADADALWITEVWDSQASHQNSLSLPAVQAAIAKGRPMIAGFSNRVETVPLGGYGLPKPPQR
jgi:quinol monooxygenase YgiN